MSSKIDKNALVFSAQLQLKKYGEFLDEYDQMLNLIIEKNFDTRELFTTTKNRVISITNGDDMELTSIFQIIESDNNILSKILITFASLFDEIQGIKNDAKALQYNFVLMDESLAELETRCKDKEKLKSTCLSTVQFGNILELLFKIKYFLENVMSLICTTMSQLGALFEVEKQYFRISTSIHFQSVFHYIGDLLVIVITFQELLSNASLSNYWQFYKQAINSIKYNLTQFDVKFDQSDIQGVENMLRDLEKLLTGDAFAQLILMINDIKIKIDPKILGVFSDHGFYYIKTTIEGVANCTTEFHENFDPLMVLKLNAMAVMFHNYFGNSEKKQLTSILELNLKHPVITLIGNLLWQAETFWNKHATSLMKGRERFTPEMLKSRQNYLSQRNQAITRDTKNYFIQVTLWNIELKDVIEQKKTEISNEQTKKLSSLLFQGVHYAAQIIHMIRSTTNLHVFLSTKMSKSTLFSITKLIELLQSIKITFDRYKNTITASLHFISQHNVYKILSAITPAKNKKMADSTVFAKNVDRIAALTIVEKVFYGPPTSKRMYIGRLALAASNPSNTFGDALSIIEKHICDIEMIAKINEKIEELCDPSFLYWHNSIIPLHFKLIYENNFKLDSLLFITGMTNNCYEKFTQRKLGIVSNSTLETYKNEMRCALEKEVIQKLCQEIENFLRLEYHSNLQLETFNPFFAGKEYYTIKSLAWLEPLQLFGRQILLKDHVECYLNATYYNLTTISLHDWKTYCEMKKLLNFKFRLDTQNDHLPTQTLEQGLDILQIMRNINVFVTKYLYNLNNQIFIEQNSNSKYLNTINITHVANSLRAHGSGIVNTSVNFTYQFLRNKFQVFSQFMFDQEIESRLLKEAKYIKELKESGKTDLKPYPFERADNLSRSIKKLGMSPQGISYLDMFRCLISQIGNALGYVRMIRSGAIHFTADISTFLPELDENLKFVFLAKENGLSKTTIQAAEDLEANIENMSKTFAEGAEYFKLLVETFAPFFRNPKHIHLKNFYLIVPALTLNFIEHMLTSKDKLTKKDQTGALFTDDGFAIGLAYIFKLLDQVSDFNALHWFKTLRQKYVAELKDLNEKRRAQEGIRIDEKLQQTFALTEKRIKTFQQEFELLFYSLSSAKVFFQ